MLARTLILTLLALFSWNAMAAKVPWSGRKQTVQVPVDQEVELAGQLATELLAELTVVEDERATLVNQVAQRLFAQIPGKAGDRSWRAVLVDGDGVEIVALPDGSVIVHTGMLSVLNSEAELAAIMAHTIAHAFARHGAERITSSLLLPGLLTTDGLSLVDPQYGSHIMADLGAGTSIGVVLPFSRKHEEEADLLGMKLMARAGYDPRAMGTAVALVSDAFGDSGRLTWLSTHPVSSKRKQRITESVPEVQKDYDKAENQYGLGVRLNP